MAEITYSIHYLDHPWDEKARKAGVKAYCLCREVRLPVMPGMANGHQVSWEPVAMFDRNSEANMFQRFCASDAKAIRLSYDMEELLAAEHRLSESRTKK